jgi:hypothetical protein
MNKYLEKPELFDLICFLIFAISLSISIYLFSGSKYLFAILLLIVSLWAFVIVVGRIVFGPAYLEGHIVRLLKKYGSEMKESDLKKYYAQYGSMDFVLTRLKQRNVIEIEDGFIKLFEDEISRGFKNKLMMWGSRRAKI